MGNGVLVVLILCSVWIVVDDIGFCWIVSGIKGEIEFISLFGIMVGFLEVRLWIRKWGFEVEEVGVGDEDFDYVKVVIVLGGNVVRVWEVFYKSDGGCVVLINDFLRIYEFLEMIIDKGIYVFWVEGFLLDWV